ncbi:hypothetical protein [Phormidesmis priestleyi]
MPTDAKSDYLGSGLALPLRQTLQGRLQFTLPINSQGNLALSGGDRNIQESIWVTAVFGVADWRDDFVNLR